MLRKSAIALSVAGLALGAATLPAAVAKAAGDKAPLQTASCSPCKPQTTTSPGQSTPWESEGCGHSTKPTTS